MHLGDAASWATIFGVPIALGMFWYTIRGAINSRQRELRSNLRAVLRDVSSAVYEYPIESHRRTAERTLVEASKKLEVIRDEGILSPKPRYIYYLQITLYDLGTREENFRRAETAFAQAMPADQWAELRPNFDRKTEEMVTYVSRVSRKFREITHRMDNGNVFTFWHYRLLPPYISRKPERRRRHPSEE
ncbi:hypothetical protein ACM0AU_04995 [Mycobacteroides abscessus subsp. abscessus]|uniref:hypothetical protein n=1 Tax=Mycobacteroides abscessus TaxID=36809 RepID=UPI0039F1119E